MNLNEFDSFDRYEHAKFCSPAQLEKDFQLLLGILEGIQADEVINQQEINSILDWLNEVKFYGDRPPYNEIKKLISMVLADNILTTEEIEDIKWLCSKFITENGYFNELTGKIQQLQGILSGIVSDQIVNDKEMNYLRNWLDNNSLIKNTYPFDEIYGLIESTCANRNISDVESKLLIQYFNAFSGRTSQVEKVNLINELTSDIYENSNIQIHEKTFCLTGESNKYFRKEIFQKIELFGGFASKGVSKKIDYLVICSERNACWAFTNYGRKIEQVINLKKNGVNIAIIHEDDLMETITSYEESIK
jgi:NAD-dependent DNA ligase